MNRNTLIRLLLCVVLSSVANITFAQTKSAAFQEYINKYKAIAVEQMELHGIPASITLAQGLLESGAGSSELAKKSNNHFGIKCGSNWFGPTHTHFDDGRNECFRAYDNVRASYEDHSQFLKKERYARLFRLSILDYKGWARGLKACGYATSPTYATKLIEIIELYKLYQYDTAKHFDKFQAQQVKGGDSRQIYAFNKNYYLKARRGDTFRSLAKEVDIVSLPDIMNAIKTMCWKRVK